MAPSLQHRTPASGARLPNPSRFSPPTPQQRWSLLPAPRCRSSPSPIRRSPVRRGPERGKGQPEQFDRTAGANGSRPRRRRRQARSCGSCVVKVLQFPPIALGDRLIVHRPRWSASRPNPVCSIGTGSNELSYPPFEPNAAHLFFQLVSRRYERGSMMITSNRSLGDPVVANTVSSSPSAATATACAKKTPTNPEDVNP
jgi:hypothetical protein